MNFLGRASTSVCAFACAAIPGIVAAGCRLPHSTLPDNPTALDRLQRYVSVRKSYSGSLKDSQAPAEIAYENPDGGASFARIDVAMKFSGWECTPKGKTVFRSRIKPIAEYHRSHNSIEQIKKTVLSAVYQAEIGFDYDFTNGILTDLKYERARDSVLDQTTRTESIVVAYSSDLKYAPGYSFETDGGGRRYFRYMPSIAFERYDKLAIKQKQGEVTTILAPEVHANFFAVRLNGEVRPFPETFDESLVLTATKTWRHRTGRNDSIPDNTDLLELSLDYYIDAQKRVAFGISYSKGHNPTRNFLNEEVSTVGLKFKLGAEN